MSNSDKGKQEKPQDGTKTGHDRSTGTKHETNDMAFLMDIPTPKPAKPATVYACAICKATFLKVAQRNRHINDNHSLISPASKT